MSITEADFANAKFAEHADGGIAMRNALDLDWATSGGYQEYTDRGMLDGGWQPVATQIAFPRTEYGVIYTPEPDAVGVIWFGSASAGEAWAAEQADPEEWRVIRREVGGWVTA